jgi:predicted aspartyl protease
MQRLVALVAESCILVASFCLGACGEDTNLKRLYEGHRWFELREAVAKGSAPALYQGAVACAFNDLHQCEKILKPLLTHERESPFAIEAHTLLAAAYLRCGKYRQALAETDAVLALSPKDSAVSGDRPLLVHLSRFPEQKIVRGRFTTLRLEESGLPVTVNGVHTTYWIDTGANVSVISEREAKRFGLQIVDGTIRIGDVTGTELPSRVAVADKMSIGSIRLKHVAFLILSDSQPPFNQSQPGEGGLIGLPVILALQRLVWRADRTFEIDSRVRNKSTPKANMCFDGQHPVVQVEFENHELAFTLDTGSTSTELYPQFAAAFPELIRTASRTGAYKMEGAGGSKNMDAAVLPSLHFGIAGFQVVLSPAGVLLSNTVENSKFFDGNLGIDLLQQTHKTIFDFKAMNLTLE